MLKYLISNQRSCYELGKIVKSLFGASYSGRTTRKGDIKSRVLDIGYQSSKLTSESLETFNKIREYGAKNGVNVKLNPVN